MEPLSETAGPNTPPVALRRLSTIELSAPRAMTPVTRPNNAAPRILKVKKNGVIISEWGSVMDPDEPGKESTPVYAPGDKPIGAASSPWEDP